MRTRPSFALAPMVLLVTALVLSACSTEPIDNTNEVTSPIQHEVVETSLPDAPKESDATKGLSAEAIEMGYTAVEMPSGWPSELPLPKGIPVSAFRSGENFVISIDLSSVSAGEDVIAWYLASDWTLAADLETDGARVMSFESSETNDYGPLRRVTLGLGANDWPTAFLYTLEVQE